jgi:hypothetical protein
METIIFNMATMPPRTPALEDSIPSILPQCDVLNVYLNDFDEVPKILNHKKINVFKSQDYEGNLGDVGKFFFCDTWNEGYIFTADDKIIYPKNHVKEHIDLIERSNRKAVVSCHGRILKPNCVSYYNDAHPFFGCLGTTSKDTFVHELGTGVMAFHHSTVKVNLEMFPTINMTDIWFSIELQKLGIPIIVRQHFKGDYKISQRHDDSYSIHATFNKQNKDAYQTKVINDFTWKINECPLAAKK